MMLGVLNQKQQHDPNLTALLLHFNGANGSTTFTDSSPYAHVVQTHMGSPIISTAQSKFGGSSLYLNGSSSLLLPNHHQILNALDDDFTYEFFIYLPAANTGTDIIFVRFYSVAPQISIVGTQDINYGSPYNTGTIPLNQWVHCAYVRHGSVRYVFVDGVLVDTNSPDNNNYPDGSTNTVIGAWPSGGQFLHAYLDEFRVRKEAMYLTNFTPPNAPFTY